MTMALCGYEHSEIAFPLQLGLYSQLLYQYTAMTSTEDSTEGYELTVYAARHLTYAYLRMYP